MWGLNVFMEHMLRLRRAPYIGRMERLTPY
jgi:hypothetical protein